jgi:hypothetical protein
MSVYASNPVKTRDPATVLAALALRHSIGRALLQSVRADARTACIPGRDRQRRALGWCGDAAEALDTLGAARL